MVLRCSHLSLKCLPSPGKYGWEFMVGKWFVSAYNYCNLPALLALVEMSSCECKKECLSNKCKHFKNNLVCTDLCKYILCGNDGKDIYYAEKDIYVKSDDDE